jgi:tRNA U34 5-carboxymethylaminomethyl modifying enzyme MnmG/GidA
MASRDNVNNVKIVSTLVPAVYKTNQTPGSGTTSVDTQGFESATVVIHTGAYTDGTLTPKLQESDNGSTWTDVAAGDLLGTFAAVGAAGDANKTFKVGYRGSKRYIALHVTASGSPATGAAVGATVILSHPKHAPAS